MWWRLLLKNHLNSNMPKKASFSCCTYRLNQLFMFQDEEQAAWLYASYDLLTSNHLGSARYLNQFLNLLCQVAVALINSVPPGTVAITLIVSCGYSARYISPWSIPIATQSGSCYLNQFLKLLCQEAVALTNSVPPGAVAITLIVSCGYSARYISP
jgi:hypothetical protein